MLNLTLLGCGGGMPMPDRFLSSLLINYHGRKILIDCGEGTQVAMRKFNAGFKSIDVICITHTHGDHIVGLPGLLSTIGNSERTDPITIIGPIGITKVIEGLMVATNYLPFEIHIIESPSIPLDFVISSNRLHIKNLDYSTKIEMSISTIELEHSSPCLGYSFYLYRRPKFLIEKAKENNVPKEIWTKLQNGETVILNDKSYEPSMVLGEEREGIKLSYITDTRPIETISNFINRSDLFICEGTYGEDEDLKKAVKNKHMTFTEAGELARNGDVGELLLTHFSPALDNLELYKLNVKSVFKDVIIGFDGLVKTLSFEG